MSFLGMRRTWVADGNVTKLYGTCIRQYVWHLEISRFMLKYLTEMHARHGEGNVKRRLSTTSLHRPSGKPVRHPMARA